MWSHGLKSYTNFSYSIFRSSTMYHLHNVCTGKEMWKYIVFHCECNKEAFCWLTPALAVLHSWMGFILWVLPLHHFCHGNSFKEISNSCKGKLAYTTSKTLKEFSGEISETALDLQFRGSFKFLQSPRQRRAETSSEKGPCPSSGLGRRGCAVPARPPRWRAWQSGEELVMAAYCTRHLSRPRSSPRASQHVQRWVTTSSCLHLGRAHSYQVLICL